MKDNDRVSVRLESERPVILEDVVCRVHPEFKLAMHIDPDEGNSAGWNKSVTGKIVKIISRGALRFDDREISPPAARETFLKKFLWTLQNLLSGLRRLVISSAGKRV